MAKQKEIWNELVKPTSQPTIIGYDRRKMSFPIRIKKTEFKNSRDFAALQIADILAGTYAKYFKWIIEGAKEDDEYGKKLDINIFDKFDNHIIWPLMDVTPQELGTIGADAEDPFEYFIKIINNLSY